MGMKTEDYTQKIEEYGKPMVSRMSERFQDIQHRVGDSAKNFGHNADEYVHQHPWQTVAIVGLVACLLGYLFGNRRGY